MEDKEQSKHLNGNTHEQTETHNCSGNMKHMLFMLVCCLTPIGAIFLLKLSGYEGPGIYLVLLLCPVMHIFMMKKMVRNKEAESYDLKTNK